MRNSIKKLSKHRRTPFSDDLYSQDKEDVQLADIRVMPDDGHVTVVPINHPIDEQDNIDRLLVDTGFDRLLPGIAGQNDTFATIEDIDVEAHRPPENNAAEAHKLDRQMTMDQTLAENQPFVEAPYKVVPSEETVSRARMVANKTAPTASKPDNHELSYLTALLAGAALAATVFLGFMVFEMKAELKQLNMQLNDRAELAEHEHGGGFEATNNPSPSDTTMDAP